MVTLFVLIAVLCGITIGLVIAALGVRNKSMHVINSISKMSDAYVLVIAEVVTGQVSLNDISSLQSIGAVGIVCDEIEFYKEEGKTQEQIIECLYQSLNTALEDEHLDQIKPLEKFDFFKGLEDMKND